MAEQLQCTRCGNERPHAYWRDRRPDGAQIFCQCHNCGAQNWEAQAGEPWAGIRYVEQNPPEPPSVIPVQEMVR